MTDFRETDDGRLFAPKRGNPPDCPPGYVRDPHNQYAFIPIVGICESRVEYKFPSSCCGCSYKTFCDRLQFFITYKHCLRCKEEPEWISNYLKKFGLPGKDQVSILLTGGERVGVE